MKNVCFFAIALFATPLSASVAFDFYIGKLTDKDGAFLPEGGLVQIIGVAVGASGFSSPTAESFLGENEFLLASFDVNLDQGGGEPGSVIYSLSTINLAGPIQSGAALTLRWWPTLTLSSVAPGEGTFYGEGNPLYLTGYGSFSDWAIPTDGQMINLSYMTESLGGNVTLDAAKASYQVIPEPSTYALGGSMLLGALIAIRRRRRQ